MNAEEYDNIMEPILEWEREVDEHNNGILKIINGKDEDFGELIDYCQITNKMEWVNKPKFKPEQNPDVFGIFTLTHVDQWTTGMHGDSYAGFMYVKVQGFDKWLKIPYSC